MRFGLMFGIPLWILVIGLAVFAWWWFKKRTA